MTKTTWLIMLPLVFGLIEHISAQCPSLMSIVSVDRIQFTYDSAPPEAPDAVTYENNRYNLSDVTSTVFITGNTGLGLTLGGEVTIHYSGSDVGCVYNILGILESTAPVELSFFGGRLSENDIELNWITSSETNNAGFEVQRSFDGNNFENISMIPGFGTSEGSNAYQFTDEAVRVRALNNQVYYRLKQIDFDGTSAYSAIISVDLNLELEQFEITKITGWNTTERKIKVYFHSYAGIKKINVILADISGNVIEQRSLYPELGLSYFEFDLADLHSDLYFLSLNNGKTIICEKIALAKKY